MGRCKDCKWWNRIKNTHFGDCNAMCPDPNIEFVYTEVGIDILEFGANFGCIHFQRKTSLEDSIEELGLSILPLRALKSSGIKKVGDLVGRTPRELLVIRKVGEKSLQKIESQLEEYDLVERQDEDGCIHFERRGK